MNVTYKWDKTQKKRGEDYGAKWIEVKNPHGISKETHGDRESGWYLTRDSAMQQVTVPCKGWAKEKRTNKQIWLFVEKKYTESEREGWTLMGLYTFLPLIMVSTARAGRAPFLYRWLLQILEAYGRCGLREIMFSFSNFNFILLNIIIISINKIMFSFYF